jgi:hypothetical protein
MGSLECEAEEAVSAAVGLVELVAGVFVVAVVGEPAEVEIEMVGPVGVGERRVQDDERMSSLAGPVGDAESAAVTAGDEPGDRVISECSGRSALIDRVDVEVGVGKVGEPSRF